MFLVKCILADLMRGYIEVPGGDSHGMHPGLPCLSPRKEVLENLLWHPYSEQLLSAQLTRCMHRHSH